MVTGAHISSIQAIASGEADIAAIDGMSLQLLRKTQPELCTHLKIIAWLEPCLNPPYVTSNTHNLNVVIELQNALRTVFSSHASNSKTYLQALHISGIDCTYSLQDYQACIDKLTANIQSVPFLSELLSITYCNSPFKQNCTLSLPSMGLKQVELVSSARKDDRNWPRADATFACHLRHTISLFLLQTIATSLQSIPECAENELDVFLLAVEKLAERKEQLILIQGKSVRECGKLILCSVDAVLLLLLSLCTLSEQVEDSGNNLVTWPEGLSKERLCRLASTASIKGNLDITGIASMQATFFFGCSSSYRQANVKTSSQSQLMLADMLLKQLWAADMSLSQQLIDTGEQLGLYAYLSAPRGNDRRDWGNVVIGRDASAIAAWRTNVSHRSVTQALAPVCYEHIRLHRMLLTGGLGGSRAEVQLLQTIFLQSEEVDSQTTSK